MQQTQYTSLVHSFAIILLFCFLFLLRLNNFIQALYFAVFPLGFYLYSFYLFRFLFYSIRFYLFRFIVTEIKDRSSTWTPYRLWSCPKGNKYILLSSLLIFTQECTKQFLSIILISRRFMHTQICWNRSTEAGTINCTYGVVLLFNVSQNQ